MQLQKMMIPKTFPKTTTMLGSPNEPLNNDNGLQTSLKWYQRFLEVRALLLDDTRRSMNTDARAEANLCAYMIQWNVMAKFVRARGR